MNKDDLAKVAKNLLEGKTCDSCVFTPRAVEYVRWCSYRRKIPKSDTCNNYVYDYSFVVKI